MNAQAYITILANRLSRYFDTKDADTYPLPFDLVAELNASDEGYFLLKDIKTYSVKHNEYLYVKAYQAPLTKAFVEPYLEYLKEQMRNLKTTTEHMSSLFALVLVCESGIDEGLAKELSKYKFHKDYAFTLKGWSDLAIYVVDVQTQKLFFNKAGKKNEQYFSF